MVSIDWLNRASKRTPINLQITQEDTGGSKEHKKRQKKKFVKKS